MTLRSIQNQSLKDFEIIIVDDGSLEEKIKDILFEMKDDNRIILLRHKERKGTLLARVDGIRYASGEYIIQIDQDDIYLNNLLFEKLYNKSKELDIV
jgi:glycosyltransferase involved in cell wall biosynthesis